MKEIANNDYYELRYNQAENCIYWKMKGFWKDMSVVPDFQADWKKARSMTKQGWKILSDATECKAFPSAVNEEKVRNQNESLEMGCKRIALVVNSAVTGLAINNGMNKSGINGIVKQFDTSGLDDAKMWLRE